MTDRPPGQAPSPRRRIASVDVLWAMALMVPDHARDFAHRESFLFDRPTSRGRRRTSS